MRHLISDPARLPAEDFGENAMGPANRLLGSPLMDMGNPTFVDRCFERFSSILDKGKISLCRQDYGANPADIFNHPALNAAEVHRAVRLKGLDPAATYKLWNRETGKRTVMSGNALMHEGFSVELSRPQSAAAISITLCGR